MNERLKPLKPLMIALFTVLLGGALLFWKQRMLFLDAPHTLFRIINSHELIITVGRYGSFVTQLLPWAGVWLHLPLHCLMMLYSASFNLFFIAAALLFLYKYKRYDLAILLVLYLTLFTSDTYFWTNNEVHEGITWLLLAFAITTFSTNRKRPLLITVPIFVVLFFLAIWTHPLVMFAAAYLWLFYWISGVAWPYSKKESIGYTLLLAALVFVKYYQSSHNWYDGDKMDTVKNFHFKQLVAIYKAPQFHFFVKSCVTNYWLFVLLFLAGNIALLHARKYTLLALTLTFTAGYVLLICITFWDVQSLRFYLESEYMPLAIIGVAPFVYFVLPYLERKRMIGVLAFIFIVRIVYILNASSFFTQRVVALERINEKMRQKKIAKIVMPDNDKALDSILILNWGLPVESIMLSALHNDHPQNTIILSDSATLNNYMHNSKDTLLSCFERKGYEQINTYYFQFDTTTTYTLMNYKTLVE